MSRMAEILGVIFDPKFWCANRPVSHEWSRALDLILDKVIAGEASIRVRTPYQVVIGSCAPIWIENYPYAYGTIEGGPGLPTRRVRKKLAAVVAAYDASRATANLPVVRAA